MQSQLTKSRANNLQERPAVETGCTCMFKLQATQMEACHSLIDLF